MESLNARTLTSQLAEDLAWLEQHCLRKPDQHAAATAVRLAAAVTRNCIGPLLENAPPTPLHIAVVGGAGTGKSTIANLLSGAPAAEANPQAGYTRHPVAFTSQNGPLSWTGHLGFLGPLQLLRQPAPSSLDQDVYQVRRVPADASSQDLLKDFVVWDCPDMTTWAAASVDKNSRGGYLMRLLEAAGLADVLIFVASDERYNDEAPTQMLRLLLQAGKPVVAVLTKMKEADAPALVAHFQKEVVAHLPPGILSCLTIPYLTPQQLADPAHTNTRYRVPLLNQVSVLLNPAVAARRRSAQGAVQYLVKNQDQLLAVAREDVEALKAWQSAVEAGRAEFNLRYQREYLTGEKFRGFDEALVRLLELLELPGIGRFLSGTLYVLRTPYRLVKGWLGTVFSRPDASGRPEQPVLEDALAGWLDGLRTESARRANSHPLWAHVAAGFTSGGLVTQTRERFQQSLRSFQVSLNEEIERTARAIYQELEQRPGVLNTLRFSKLTIDLAAIGGTLAAGGINWHDIILVPLVASVTQFLVELFGKQWVDSERERTRERQQELMAQHVSGPLADWLTQWPATGGSTFERLQLVLNRIPPAIQQLDAMVQAR